MGNRSKNALRLIRRQIVLLNIALLTFAALRLPSHAVASTNLQRKNAPPPASLQEDFPEPADLPAELEEVEAKKLEAGRAAFLEEMRAKAREEVESAAKVVHSPNLTDLARALGVESDPAPEADLETAARSAFRQLGDLDGDGVAEAVFRWSRLDRFVSSLETADNLPGWVMFLLSWHGGRWGITELTAGDGLSGVDTIEGVWPSAGIVVVEGLSRIPYPVIFRYQDHAASLAWDSRDPKSRYQGFARGTIQFEEREGAPPAMIVSGKADPGVIRFSPWSHRGFDVATVYLWENGAYVPRKTEFEKNEDYTLYRFIAALHLRDFKTAFSLIDPPAFLKEGDKTLKEFQKVMERNWPEFLGNSIFEALELEDEGEGHSPFAFGLDRGPIRYVYSPTFSRDGRLLLTGLEKRRTRRAVEDGR